MRLFHGFPRGHALLMAATVLVCLLGLWWLTPASIKAPASTAMHRIDTAIKAHKGPRWFSETVRKGDTFSGIAARRGLGSEQVHTLMQLPHASQTLLSLKPGQTLWFRQDSHARLLTLWFRPALTDTFRIDLQKEPQKVSQENTAANPTPVYISQLQQRPLEKRIAYGEASITDSLFASAKRAGLSANMVMKLADVFAYEIDFAQDLQDGDHYSVMYEAWYLDGKKVRDGDLLAVKFFNDGKWHQAVRGETAPGKYAYFSPDGHSLKRAFLRSPMDFARISSQFSLARYHPVLHRMRAHKGVDYAASTGTPIRATANGRVQLAGSNSGFGNVVILRHFGPYSTLYGHMSRFAKGIHNGVQVSQGDVIGYVGATGLASGPHLHYEFHVGNDVRDPLKVPLPQAMPLEGPLRQHFLASATQLMAQLDLYSRNRRVAAMTPAVTHGG